VEALGELKTQGFKLCIISNTDILTTTLSREILQMGGHIDRVITAQHA
jgi:2-haloacid dehalogenase